MSIFRLHLPNLLLAIPHSSQCFLLLLCYHERHTRPGTLDLRGRHRLINEIDFGDRRAAAATEEGDGPLARGAAGAGGDCCAIKSCLRSWADIRP